MRLRGMVVVCLVACGGGGGGGDDAPVIDAPIDAPVGRSMIGPAGGAVMSMDGVAKLTIPAGALTAETEITIDAVAQVPASIAPATPIGAVYAIGPEGTVFAVPATLEWRFATAPAGSKDAANRPKVLFGYSRSAVDVIQAHVETRSEHVGAALTITSKLAHLSEQFLSARVRSGANVFLEVGSVVAELGGGRHAVGAEWAARKIELHPADLNVAQPYLYRDVDAPVELPDQPEWMMGFGGNGEGYTEAMPVSLSPGNTYRPTVLPKFRCATPGMGKAHHGFILHLGVFNDVIVGGVFFHEEVECYDRVQKTEYTVEAGFLGQTRIAPLAVPATTTVDLATHQGAYGHQVCVLPGQTITVCVGASMPTAVNYFPQYPPGFTFVDGAPGSGCVTITNLDPNDSNCVLVKSEGGGSPNNVTVTTTTP